ncbi:acyl carrier protein [Nonomuraea sp. KM88]|uniref:acyl carrier protein n=1 Tax=Nonomuraea sp. KM88 TaxID=3457427 RepID=UPI003FCCDD51
MVHEEQNIADDVLKIIKATLLVESVDMKDNLFDVGADSLTLLEICTQIEEGFEIEVPLESVWEAPSALDIIRIVEDCVQKARGLTAGGREAETPAS